MSLSDAAESSRSRARREPGPSGEVPEHPRWVALASVPVAIPPEDDEGARAFAHGTAPMALPDGHGDDDRIPSVLGTLVRLELQRPPSVSRLILHPAFSSPPSNSSHPPQALHHYVVATDSSGRLLLEVVHSNRANFVLYDANYRTLNVVTKAPISELGGLNIHPHRSLGLFVDPHPHQGSGPHVTIAQLHPTTSAASVGSLLHYSTATGQWEARPLSRSSRSMPDPSSEHGVISHGGKLWWLSLAYGIFCCDPSLERPHLTFVPLPDGCAMDYDGSVDKTLIDQRRCFKTSEGWLRYVQIGGGGSAAALATPPTDPTVTLWTLVNPEGDNPWKLEYTVSFTEVWTQQSYFGAGLTPTVLPHVAFIDPDDHFLLYFFEGSSLFSLDTRHNNVVACKEYKSLNDDRQALFKSSRSIVDAWELLPPPQSSPPTPHYETQIPQVQGGQKILPNYIMSLMEQDFNQICARTRYCFTCRQAFCLDCCAGHERFHHPGNEQARIVQVRVVRHAHCIQEEDLKSIRYDLRGIQKFNVEGVKYIPIKRNIIPGAMPLPCKHCHDRMYVNKDYCGLLCRLQHVPGGNVQSRAILSALAHTAFHRQALDRFCTVCRRLFYSSCCADHIASHHPGQTEVGSVLRILRTDGMILTPLSDLVEFNEVDLARIETIAFNGYNTVAVKKTENYPNDEAGNLCVECYKVIGESFYYCCLPCMIYSVYY